jgi:hypothetical protein
MCAFMGKEQMKGDESLAQKSTSSVRLWTFVSLRPEISGLHVDRQDTMLKLIPTRFPNLRYLELEAELITPMVNYHHFERLFLVFVMQHREVNFAD